MSAKELKPCPFCGGNPTASQSRNSLDEMDYIVECAAADCRVRPVCFVVGYSKAETVEAWNRRAALPSETAQQGGGSPPSAAGGTR